MYTTADYLINQSLAPAGSRTGLALYNEARLRSRLQQVRAAFTGRNRTLQHLPHAALGSRRLAGVCSVPVCEIVGSEDRVGDFDRDFNPLREATRDRWLSVYSAWVNGVALPPIELVRGPGGYYVRDGHHRLSVARALRQDYIEAVVSE